LKRVATSIIAALKPVVTSIDVGNQAIRVHQVTVDVAMKNFPPFLLPQLSRINSPVPESLANVLLNKCLI
jgi:hypothetical protein